MDSKGFTQTSFCNISIDNITTNKDKEYILSQLNIACNKRYSDRYAKVYNDKFSKNLKNPHILCLKSSGTPYLMYITRINDINYTFFIDKKIKEGYDYPKIFILPIKFSDDVYNNTLLECELIRDNSNKWYISIGDSYYMKGKNTNKTIIIDRINDITKMLDNDLMMSEFLNTCTFQVKRYFDYKDINFIEKEFIPLLNYNIRGYYLIPLKPEYSKMLYLIDKLYNKSQNINTHKVNKKIQHEKSNRNNTFRLVKTAKPDVYDLYKKSTDNEYIREGILLVQTMKESHLLAEYFRNKNCTDEVLIECDYNNYFNKWKFKNFV